MEDSRCVLEKSTDIRLAHNSDRIGNPYSNMASLLLCMGNVDATEEMLSRFLSLQSFTDGTFLKFGNPRFSGYAYALRKNNLFMAADPTAVT